MLVNGVSSSAAIAANGDMHASGTVIGDTGGSFGQVTAGGASGSASVTGTSAHFTANVQIDGNLNGGAIVVGGQAGVSTVSSSPSPPDAAYCNTLASAINGIISRLNSSGLI